MEGRRSLVSGPSETVPEFPSHSGGEPGWEMYPAKSWLAALISSCCSVITLSFTGKPAEAPGNQWPSQEIVRSITRLVRKAAHIAVFFTDKLPVFTLGDADPPLLEVREQGQWSLCSVLWHAHTHTHSDTLFAEGHVLFLSFFLGGDTTHQGVWFTATLTRRSAESSHPGP